MNRRVPAVALLAGALAAPVLVSPPSIRSLDVEPPNAPASQAAADIPAKSAEGFRRALSPWDWDLPSDHGSHPEFALEWWYLTGRLVAEGGEEFGYQATFFRMGLDPAAPRTGSTFRTGQAFVFHGAVTDLERGTFSHAQDAARGAAGWAGAAEERLDVHVFDRTLRQVSDSTWRLEARVDGWRLELDYLLAGPVVLHGEDGLSRKGPGPGQASHYVTRPQLPTSGTLVRPDGTRLLVEGLSWFDQEFGSAQLSATQAGWDWFSARLTDGSTLMLYLLREKDGGVTATSSGTFVDPDGRTVHLALEDFDVRVTDTWTSPETGATWPAGWTLTIPRLALELDVTPLLAAQEMTTRATTGVVYWEGLCGYDGQRAGDRVEGHGHVEIVGPAGPVAGLRAGRWP